jgi:hypothetical protein
MRGLKSQPKPGSAMSVVKNCLCAAKRREIPFTSHWGAFSSEAGIGSREENASKQKTGAPF